MKIIKNQEFGGERPLYTLHDARLENVTIHLGESSIKESGNIEAENCTFEGKYVFWECRGFKTTNCLYRESARSSLWYSENGTLVNCRVEAPKMFRRMKGIRIENCTFTNAQETLWDCDDVVIKNSRIENADYLGMHTNNVRIENYHQEGNYSFQYSKNVEIKNSLLNSKDAFWECENVTLTDCEINGEYLGWYSRNLRLIRCHITGEQPLCYCENLYMEDCTMGEDANLAFEYSTLQATIKGHVHSIKNPTSGNIEVESVGEIIIDENQKSPADCKIKVKG
jgi:polygalacturonase